MSELENDKSFKEYLNTRKSSDADDIEKNLTALKNTNPDMRIFVGYSSSRKELWPKGLTSGNVQEIKELTDDCVNIVQASVVPSGPACHEGQYSCFFRHISGEYPIDMSSVSGFAPESFDANMLDYNAITKRFPSKQGVIPVVFFGQDNGRAELRNLCYYERAGVEFLLKNKYEGIFADCDKDSLVVFV